LSDLNIAHNSHSLASKNSEYAAALGRRQKGAPKKFGRGYFDLFQKKKNNLYHAESERKALTPKVTVLFALHDAREKALNGIFDCRGNCELDTQPRKEIQPNE